MHFHLPKPLHGWREFAGEVAIIVLGVMIALGAEQLVESLSWRERLKQAEASMAKELGEDDGAQAYERFAMNACITRELERTEKALIAERDRHVPFVPAALFAPPSRSWDENAWLAASSSGATSRMSADRMYLWSTPYALTPDMNQGALREAQDWAELDRIDIVSVHPSETERERIMGALARARQDNAFMDFMSGVFVRSSEQVGVRVPTSLRRYAVSRLPAALTHC